MNTCSSLLKTVNRLYVRIINSRLTEIADMVHLEEQSGFQNGRSCNGIMLFANDQIILQKTHDDLESAMHRLRLIYKDYNLTVITNEKVV